MVLKERRSKDSVTLAWQGPERPNGEIVEYEVIYYEKVNDTRARAHTSSFLKEENGCLNRKPDGERFHLHACTRNMAPPHTSARVGGSRQQIFF